MIFRRLSEQVSFRIDTDFGEVSSFYKADIVQPIYKH